MVKGRKEVSLSDGVIYETEKEEEVVTDNRSPINSVSVCVCVCVCVCVWLCT